MKQMTVEEKAHAWDMFVEAVERDSNGETAAQLIASEYASHYIVYSENCIGHWRRWQAAHA